MPTRGERLELIRENLENILIGNGSIDQLEAEAWRYHQALTGYSITIVQARRLRMCLEIFDLHRHHGAHLTPERFAREMNDVRLRVSCRVTEWQTTPVAAYLDHNEERLRLRG